MVDTASIIIHLGQALIVPICCLSAWAFIGLMGWQILSALTHGIQLTQQLHQIPCADCRFFTGDYHLKCPVHPYAALSEQAINCEDFLKV